MIPRLPDFKLFAEGNPKSGRNVFVKRSSLKGKQKTLKSKTQDKKFPGTQKSVLRDPEIEPFPSAPPPLAISDQPQLGKPQGEANNFLWEL